MENHDPNQKPIEKPNQMTMLKLVGYILGGLFALTTIRLVFEGHTGSAILVATMSAILLPPSIAAIQKKMNIQLSRGVRFGALVLLFFIFGASMPKNMSESRSSTPKVTDSPQQSAKQEYIAKSCTSVSAIFDASSNLTDLQKDEIWKNEFENRAFKWKLQVVEVSKGILGGYNVQFKCQNSQSFIQDIVVSYPEEMKDSVLNLQKSKFYEISGKFDHQTTLLGLSADFFVDDRSPASN